MLPDIHRATQKFYIFLIVYLTGCTPRFSSRASVLNELNSNLTNFIFGDIIGKEFVKIVRGIQMMQKLKEENYPVRILVYIFGLFIMTLGISMSVKSDLGVSPVSSIPYSIPF